MRIFSILISNTIPFCFGKNPNCPDPDKAEECEVICGNSMFECIKECPDEICYSSCYRENISCIDGEHNNNNFQ